MLPRLRTSGRVREDAHLTVFTVFTVFGVLPTIPSCSHLEFIVARTAVWNFQEDGLLHILHCNPTELNSRSRTQNLLLLPPECSFWPPRQPSSSNITGNMFISSGKQITMNQIRSGRGRSAPSFWEEPSTDVGPAGEDASTWPLASVENDVHACVCSMFVVSKQRIYSITAADKIRLRRRRRRVPCVRVDRRDQIPRGYVRIC